MTFQNKISAISKRFRYLFFYVFFILFSCEKDITIDLPKAKTKLVVEGRIETGSLPIVILTKSLGYFDPTDINSLENNFVRGAVITISDGINQTTLTEFCSSSFTDEQLQAIAAISGISYDALKSFNYCIYTTLNPQFIGINGKTYKLNILAEGNMYYSQTKIPFPVPLDSLWFKPEIDSLGFIWATLDEPDTLGNCYRWFAKRLGKDKSYIAPIGSAFEDKFVNNTRFDFAYFRGSVPGSESPDDNNSEAGFFKKGDTVVVKFCSLDMGAYKFFRTYETNISNGGNPFASPSIVESNIIGENVLGVWAGYGSYLDTLVIKR